jgi:ribulose-5-phosphate 4-epimerase/fuculose-1-phosphate aldolase
MSRPFPDEAAARAEICRVGRSLFERGYAHATAGNISVRLADGFLITPTDACLGFLEPDRLSRLDGDGHLLSGASASKTLALHRRIYEATQAAGNPAGAVIHTHSTWLVACSLKACGSSPCLDADAELLPPITPYFVMKVGRVPHIAYHRPGAPDAAEAVANVIARHAQQGRMLRAVMLARLGPNVWHDTPAAAMAVLEELEETARLWMLTQPAPLEEAQLAELRRVFGAAW